MGDERWRRVRELFERALERRPDEWEAFLEAECGPDAELRDEVASLLSSHREASGLAGTTVRLPPTGGAEGARTFEGRRVGPYRVEHLLGEGGMGAVYLAVRADDEFRRRVALKILKPAMVSEEILRRFRTERQILAGLDHPNIAKLLDGGTTEEGLPYFVMEYVEGTQILRYCDEQQLSLRGRIELFRQICSAVQLAHQNLVVHRDLKPANILVTSDGTPKLLDFGIAKLLNPELQGAAGAPTALWGRLLTPEYGSPEQIAGRPITTASDTYSLGLLLYELLTGHHPFRDQVRTLDDIRRWQAERTAPRPSTVVLQAQTTDGDGEPPTAAGRASERVRRWGGRSLARRLEGDLDAILLKALRSEPAKRYASAEQLAEDLERHLHGLPVSARRGTLVYRWGKFVGRHRVAVAAATVLVVASLAFGVVMGHQRSTIAAERDRAERVTRFLIDMFEVADPNRGAGRAVTARELLDRGAENLVRGLEEQPATRAELMAAVGNIYLKLGLPGEARPILEGALAERRQVFRERHVKVAESLRDLAELHQMEGDIAGAEGLFRDALEMLRERVGEEDPRVAEVSNDLGVALFYAGELEDAEERIAEGLALRRRLLGPQSVAVAESLVNLGAVRQQRGDEVAAAGHYREALAIYHDVPGHRGDEATLLNNLGALALGQGEPAEAETLFRESLALRRELFGSAHPDIAESLGNLGRALRRQEGKGEEAERRLREALAMRRDLLGPDHPNLANSLYSLGELLAERGDWEAALPLAREAEAILRRTLPEGHLYTALAGSLLGGCLARTGEHEAAEELLRASREVLVAQRGEGHPDVVRTDRRLEYLEARREATGRAP